VISNERWVEKRKLYIINPFFLVLPH